MSNDSHEDVIADRARLVGMRTHISPVRAHHAPDDASPELREAAKKVARGEPEGCAPIVLTEFGETLDDIKNKEDDKISFKGSYLGILRVGQYFVYALPISESHYVLYSKAIGRIGDPIPIEVDTFGKLREWCKTQIVQKKEWEERLATLWSCFPYKD
jgi:hypothetical protein